MIVETEVEGEPDQVRAVADWLRGTYQAAVERAAQHTQAARQLVGGEWGGQAASTYSRAARAVVASCDAEAARIGRAADLLDVLATRMQQRENWMERIRGRARDAGLVVTGTRIRHVDRTDIGVPADDAEAAAKDHEADLEILLQDLGQEVDEAHQTFRDWVHGELDLAVQAERRRAHLGPTPGEIGSALAKNLATGAASAVSSKVDFALSVGGAALALGKGEPGEFDDTDAGVVVSTVAGAGVDAAVSSTPWSVVAGAVVDTGVDLAGGEDGRDPLAPPPTDPDPGRRGPRGPSPRPEER
ncbi:hypothetical protein G5V58_16975 [Nocardioides anomalus]|uniref:Uncharacterized protein n=1 Tax=Nocardioides anomalus TaxID=2712223 RepID=A0A6G6WGR0_9ACTN|nr:hypothetical protein [Nocardioides anomalus]QIG44240.1 hypothetical protein G5V58_16975 [Nocardioides anomalus]